MRRELSMRFVTACFFTKHRRDNVLTGRCGESFTHRSGTNERVYKYCGKVVCTLHQKVVRSLSRDYEVATASPLVLTKFAYETYDARFFRIACCAALDENALG